MKEVLDYNEKELKPAVSSEKIEWTKIISHNKDEIKGFFGEY